MSRLEAHAAILGAQIIWASWNVLSKQLMQNGSDPVVFATYRELGCAAVLSLAVFARHRCTETVAPTPTLREAALLVCCGTALAMFQLSFLFGVSKVDANTASLSILLIPVLVLIATAALGWEPLPLCNAPAERLVATYTKLGGVAAALSGCAVLVLKPTATAAGASATTWVYGCGFLLLSGSGTVVFVLTQKPLLRRFGELEVIASCYTVAAALAACGCLIWTLRPGGRGLLGLVLAPRELWALLYTVSLVGCAAYPLFTFANVRLPATLVTLYGILQPLLTSLLAYLVLGEAPSGASLVGGPLIVLGLLLTTMATVAAPPAEQRPPLSEPLLPSAAPPKPSPSKLPVLYSTRKKSFPRQPQQRDVVVAVVEF